MNRNIRDYEVSVWTLQDSFITVLKPSGMDNKGTIEEPDFDLKNDGTLTFKFSIPMYLIENNVRIENPIWYNTRNGNIIADLRKIKVIFHKNTEQESIFELLITKVTESHEGFPLTCEVECEGLAFHELGKSGYKLSLNQDTFIEDWTKWANDENASAENEPKSNINYWCDKVFEGTDWTYEINMNWEGYETSRDSDKIYEDAYAAAWDVQNNKLIPTTVVQKKEKERLVDIEESNRYNITQTIAETFGVHCRYEYEHDSDYHISARKVIFYNAFIQESLGPIDINYAYDTADISREMDGKDTITKMYVKTLTDSNTESGLATISDTEANKSQEDYLLNFDYLYSIGTITKEQYEAVGPYEIEMHRLNEELKSYERRISALENQRIDAAAAEAVAKNAIALDNERISANNDLLNSITNNTGEIEVGVVRPDTCAVLGDSSNYYIVLRQKGIIPNSIKIYKAFTPGTGFNDADKVLSYKLNYDEFGNLIKITDIVVTFTTNQILYLTYRYSPHLYYENILNTWKRRLARDLNEQQTQATIINEIDNELALLKTEYESTLEQKQEAINRFEHLMGAAIREGYWQPEDEYAKYGEKKTEILTLNNTAEFNDNLSSIGWDNKLFDGEDKNYYEIEITQEQQYYPCIKLSNLNIFRNYDLNKISFIYQDTTAPQGAVTDDIRYLRFLPIGSQCQLRFLRGSENVIPVLMLTGLKDVNYDIFNNNDSHPRIGILTTEVNDGSIDSNIYVIIDEATVRQNLIPSSTATSYEIVYPRIQINSANLKVAEDSLVLRYGNIVFNNYEDYYVLGRLDSITNIFRYYITIKPELLFKKGGYGSYNLLYELSNAGLFMYLDALQVLKENAYPRVSYEIKPTFVNDEFIRYAYKYLNYIVHINDPELKFEYVQGYITELQLKLDSPKDDSIKIDNYKTKFEDLFSTIVVQTEEMKKNSSLIGMAAQAFTPYGGLQPDLVQTVMDRVDLNYAFNNGTLTINEEDGIWGTSDSGVVAFRGGGIFTATEKDENDDWIWNTGILPSGINASLITTGQLDTNLIRIYAGDDLKLQMNGDGLFAYRSQWSNDNNTVAANPNRSDGLDLGQYVVHNGDGLFLVAEAGTQIPQQNGPSKTLATNINRVSISWDGLTLRNWNNDPTFYADPDTGDLTLTGTINATALNISQNGSSQPIDSYVNARTNGLINNVQIEYGTSTASNIPPNNWSITTPNWSANTYIWQRTVITQNGSTNPVYKPDANGVCIQAAAARSIELSGEQVFIYDVNQSSTTPSAIVLTVLATNLSIGDWFYKDIQAASGWSPLTGATGNSTYTVYPPNAQQAIAGAWVDNQMVVKVTDSTGNYSDIMTICFVSNGRNGTNGTNGTNGAPATNLILSNEHINFSANAAGNVVGRTVTIYLMAYTGTTAVLPNATIASSPTLPNGLTASVIQEELNDRVKITITANDGATFSDTGVIGLAVSSPIATTMQINWTVVKNGADGRGIASVTEYYAVSSSDTSSPSSWNTLANTVANWNSTYKYLWNSETVAYTSGAPDEYSNPHVVAIFSTSGRGISSITNYYVANNTASSTGSESWNWSPTITQVDSSNKYLWNYEEISYTDGSQPTTTSPCIIGNYAADGTSINILGSYNSLNDLNTAHPTGSIGDGYLINGDLYVWSATTSPASWQNVGNIQGPAGTSSYTWVRYAPNATPTADQMHTSLSNNDQYIGIAAGKSDANASTNYQDYVWAKIIGDNAIQYYTWIKYAATKTPATANEMHDSPVDGDKYIGIAYNKTSATESTDYNDYTWSQIIGEKGEKGATGDNGITYYTWIVYADDASGTNISLDPTGKEYIGIKYGQTNSQPSETPSQYTFVKYIGDDGVPMNAYIRYKQAVNSTEMHTSKQPTDKYIGIANTTGSAPTEVGNYSWSLIEATDATIYELNVSDMVITKTVNSNGTYTYSPATIVLSNTKYIGNTVSNLTTAYYKIMNGNTEVAHGNDGPSEYNQLTHTLSTSANYTQLTCELYTDNQYQNLVDTQNIYMVSNGAAGADAYTVILTNENHTFSGTTTHAIASSTTCEIITYKGNARIAHTIGQITTPTGISVTATTDGTTSTNGVVNISVTTDLQSNGILQIPITIEGQVFTKTFTYNISFEGRGISSIQAQYLLWTSNSGVTNQSPSQEQVESTEHGVYWQPTCPTWYSGYYIWTRNYITWDDNSPATTTTPVLADGLNSANELANEANELATSTSSDFKITSNQIYSEVRQQTESINALNSELNTVAEQLSTTITQTANDINFSITELRKQQSNTASTAQEINEKMQEITTYMKFDASGLSLGKTDSQLKVQLSNNELGFYDAEDKVAYINSNKMFITQAQITDQMLFGKYAFVPSGEHLALIYIG